jgi:hypothetical protein
VQEPQNLAQWEGSGKKWEGNSKEIFQKYLLNKSTIEVCYMGRASP